MSDVTVIINERFNNLNYVVDKIPHLIHQLSKRLDVQILTHPVTDISSVNGDIILTIKNLQKNTIETDEGKGYIESYIKLLKSLKDKGKKILGYHDDLDISEPGKYENLRMYHYDVLRRLIGIFDKMLVAYPTPFISKFPTQKHKLVLFPQFIAPTHRYKNLTFNDTPIKKCIVAGYDISVYRHTKGYITSKNSPLIHRIPHPGYNKNQKHTVIKGDAWAQELNKFLCGYAGTTPRNYVIAKYFEIPASGCLLLGTYGTDLKLFGFKDGINFIQVNKDNFFDKLQYIINNPKEYTDIRKAGRDLVFSRHTVDHRLETLINTIEEIRS
jgi:hypothetical protein